MATPAKSYSNLFNHADLMAAPNLAADVMWTAIDNEVEGAPTHSRIATISESSPVVIAYIDQEMSDTICLAHSPRFYRRVPGRNTVLDDNIVALVGNTPGSITSHILRAFSQGPRHQAHTLM